jgi:hypothetical protein
MKSKADMSWEGEKYHLRGGGGWNRYMDIIEIKSCGSRKEAPMKQIYYT